jgi:hypothetical protein
MQKKEVISLNIFEGVEINAVQFVGPLIVLIVTMFAVAFVYKLLFNWLPRKLYNLLIGPVMLLGLYIWGFPMNLGFYEFFK